MQGRPVPLIPWKMFFIEGVLSLGESCVGESCMTFGDNTKKGVGTTHASKVQKRENKFTLGNLVVETEEDQMCRCFVLHKLD